MRVIWPRVFIFSALVIMSIMFLMGLPARSNSCLIIVAAPTTTTVPVTTTTVPLVSELNMAKWEKVAWCETHGDWDRNEPNADGGLGINRVNWIAYGGRQFAPFPHLATPEQQVLIAERIQHGLPVPDQNGTCGPW